MPSTDEQAKRFAAMFTDLNEKQAKELIKQHGSVEDAVGPYLASIDGIAEGGTTPKKSSRSKKRASSKSSTKSSKSSKKKKKKRDDSDDEGNYSVSSRRSGGSPSAAAGGWHGDWGQGGPFVDDGSQWQYQSQNWGPQNQWCGAGGAGMAAQPWTTGMGAPGTFGCGPPHSMGGPPCSGSMGMAPGAGPRGMPQRLSPTNPFSPGYTGPSPQHQQQQQWSPGRSNSPKPTNPFAQMSQMGSPNMACGGHLAPPGSQMGHPTIPCGGRQMGSPNMGCGGHLAPPGSQMGSPNMACGSPMGSCMYPGSPAGSPGGSNMSCGGWQPPGSCAYGVSGY